MDVPVREGDDTICAMSLVHAMERADRIIFDRLVWMRNAFQKGLAVRRYGEIDAG